MDVDGFNDQYLASLYELECPWCPTDDFYLGLVRAAGDVLDVGCGTGILLGAAAEAGHHGRLVGLDPAEAMLAIARDRPGVEWVGGVLEGQWRAEFDLVTMTGNAFQELRSDDEIRAFLGAVKRALRPGGRFAFETRNPLRAAWLDWHGRRTSVIDGEGRPVDIGYHVEQVDTETVDGALVTFTERYSVAGQPEPLVARSTLRFVPAATLDRMLADAGFEIDERYGDWDRSPFTVDSGELITVAHVRQ